eukprot:852185-Prymnesium_polylepis.2
MHSASRSMIPDNFLSGQSFRRSRCAPVRSGCARSTPSVLLLGPALGRWKQRPRGATWSEQVVLQPHSRECCARPRGPNITGPSTSGAR